ncbi:MAG: sensor histidine kinase, partial [Bryobacteraceae bacterium]
PEVNRLRNRLIVVFLAATLAPIGVTVWMTTSLLDHSLSIASRRNAELDALSLSLEKTGRELYQRASAALKADASAGRIGPERLAETDHKHWPAAAQEFHDSGEPERFALSGNDGERLDYLVRRGADVWVYSTPLDVGMKSVSRQFAEARQSVEEGKAQDLRRGLTYTSMVLAAAIWLVSFAVLVYLALRISRPIHRLTAGLDELAGGNLDARVAVGRNDEVGRAIDAFNDTAAQLRQSRDRLVYLTQIASWQSLARKMAHEVKNSLTPIRLTVEEMVARHAERDAAFMEQAAQIVVDEVESLERRVRAFSQFGAEPPVHAVELGVNSVLEERVAFLRGGHPEVSYDLRLADPPPCCVADEDLVKGVLTNLLENAAEAAGAGGHILAKTARDGSTVAIEIHDSGPGLSDAVRESLFQPTISFKKRGMGLGLSIARKSALLLGGDILPVEGELGGAAFRVLLPAARS